VYIYIYIYIKWPTPVAVQITTTLSYLASSVVVALREVQQHWLLNFLFITQWVQITKCTKTFITTVF
jgi:hypothetical protein